MPPSPRIVARTGRPAPAARAKHSRRIVSSLERPTNGMVRRTERVVSPSAGKAERKPSNPFATTSRRLAVGDLRVGQGVRRDPGQDLAGLGSGLQARRRVHDLTGHEQLSGGAFARGGLARLDAHPHVERLSEPRGAAESAHAGADREARSDRAHRVVLVDVRQPEDRHDGVADELLRPPAQVLQLLRGGGEELSEDLPRSLGVEALREAGGVHEVGEEDRDDLALLGAQRRADDGAAVRAEPGVVGERMAADRTGHAPSI